MDPDYSAWLAGKSLSTDWASRFFPLWATLFQSRRDEALDVLEIGSWEGRSAIFFLNYFGKCRLTCIDTFGGSPEHALRHKSSDQLAHVEQRFDSNLAAFGERLEKIKSPSSQALARLITDERRFDIVYVDGSHHSADVQSDAVFSWPMVRDGGIVIFDDYEWTLLADEVERPKLGIDSFLSVHAGQYRELYRGEQIIIQKIGVARNERPAIPSRSSPVPREEPVDRPQAESDVEFVLIAEAGILEAQALLLCESIRCFAGSYSRSPITAVSPRSSRRPSPLTIDRFEQLGVDYLPVEIDSCCPQYGPSYQIHSLAHAERRTGPPIIIQLDSDAVFIAEPDFSLGTFSAAARPVDSKGMCTTGPDDPFDPYWRELCALAGVDYEHLPLVRTSVTGQAVRASYNGGLVAAKRASGLFQRTEDIFRKLIAANMKPWAGAEPTYNTGTGILQGEATSFWGTSQAAFSLAAVAGNHSVRLLPATHNFPLHNFNPATAPDPARLVHIHHHGLFDEGSAAANPILDGTLALPAGIREWLQARLPLRETLPAAASIPGRARHSRRKAILVLGMHRSGTSMLAGTIAALGAAHPKRPLRADGNNPKGYWESTPLNFANDELLAAAASSWHDWRPLDPQWLQSLAAERLRDKIKAILASEFGEEPLFFIKDPRICRFVPFMSSILAEMEVDPVALLPLRNPLEVAYSLQRRDGLPLAKSLLLWLRHVIEAEVHSRHMPRCFIRHEQFLIDWRHHVDRAAEMTGIVWPTPIDLAEAEIGRFLTADLHRERATVGELQSHPDVTPLIRTAYEILCAMADDGDSQKLRSELDLMRARFDDACAVVGAAAAAESDHLRGERDAISGAYHELDLERNALADDLDNPPAGRAAPLASRNWRRLTAPLRWLQRPSMRRR
ncbi:class I SAM-dependent methyltransferase [Mesorhizobium huakuii]|uniref:Class I SAM-dependent methyltransferase n=1 Tax=Mesorhizobium huakuii TaxID=28104 RepID=A0ABZ0VP23_9HYPH|nr:class I SAM-dependent methyltransferase [Mesorhizobium huakuii]WQB98200.1 class I SAM-dependent methyltransferase [Mesorhizobium huakuii]